MYVYTDVYIHVYITCCVNDIYECLVLFNVEKSYKDFWHLYSDFLETSFVCELLLSLVFRSLLLWQMWLCK